MIKVLFITEKYVHPNPQYGLTNNIHNLIGSFEESGYGSYEHLFISPDAIWHPSGVEHALLTKDYDIAIVSIFHQIPRHSVAGQLGKKLCLLWWDSIVSEGHVRSFTNCCPNLVFDWGHGEEYPNCFALQVPQDTRVFKKDVFAVDIDVSFCGAIDTVRPERARLINLIKSAGINIWSGGGRGPEQTNFHVWDYASIFKRSKICLNFAGGHGRVQRKGRVFEIAACGKFMLSNHPEAMNGKDGPWFIDGTDFVSFDENDLVDKIRYYLSHEQERQTIADNMFTKYMYNYKDFWRQIFNICGKIPI